VREAVICEPLRTAVGGFGGVFRDVPPTVLAATVIGELLRRTSLPAEEIDDVILGQGYPNGEAPAIGRVAALDAGLPIEVPGLQVDRRCGSGLQAIMLGCMEVQTGVADLVLAGGAESMSQAEFYATGMRWGVKGGSVTLEDRLARPRVTAGGINHLVAGGMIETAENLRRQYAIPRAEQDEFALRSHRLAVAAHEDGTFAEEIVPVAVKGRGEERLIDRDEHPRADTTLERLGNLRPLMARTDPEATVTAGNASGQNDGAAVCIVTHPDKAAELGLRPFARLLSWAVAGVAPETMGIGPVPSTRRALERAGLSMEDMDLIELNEAFAAQALAVLREWDLPDGLERVNVHGSGISLGHPVGATGGRILTTLLRELRRRGGRYGLETMCIGGGQGMAAIFENVAPAGG
jgi:acetyl-CoA acetyltransferase family protein